MGRVTGVRQTWVKGRQSASCDHVGPPIHVLRPTAITHHSINSQNLKSVEIELFAFGIIESQANIFGGHKQQL